ncbi:outer membrane assembly protein AsmA [Erwinia sp. HDF1-3R]|uniref:outer membrane assembly protein AsmA n=1 Tax=Erwinia sp. HDF1-3R TaxID=3141543 RepID=UPI0031F594CF
MKRFITTLAILLVVIVAGMTALVLLINPNDFRTYMTSQVEQRSGYRLALNGDLRWHVWPQLSILSGPMSLTAPGAAQPVVSAENMRLDVHLLPLLSHQLSVKQVMLKGAVIRMTPDSDSQQPANTPMAPRDSRPPETSRGWKFDIDELRMADSLLIWQQSNGEQINFRDLNLQLSQNRQKQAHLDLSSRISRDQRELLVHVNADTDMSRYPRQFSATINQLDYQLTGADLPTRGVKGQANMQLSWQGDSQAFSLKNLSLQANDSQLTGSVSGTLAERPKIDINLHSPSLNMDSLLGLTLNGSNGSQGIQAQRAAPGPVIAQPAQRSNADSPLNALDGSLKLTVDKMRWRGMDLAQVQVNAASQQGILNLTTLRGKVGQGEFSLPGRIDVSNAVSAIAFQPVFSAIPVAPLLQAFDLPASLSGNLSLTGNFSGTGLSVRSFRHDWQGRADVSLSDAQMAGLNFQQMIQRAVERSSDRVRGPSDHPAGSALQHITAGATLNKGLLAFDSLKGTSSMLNYSGEGGVNLANQQADMTFGITVTQGWQGDDEIVRRLQQTPVPLRVYGPWSALNYSLQIDQVLRQQLQDEAKKRLQQWADRNQNSDKRGSVQKLIKDL